LISPKNDLNSAVKIFHLTSFMPFDILLPFTRKGVIAVPQRRCAIKELRKNRKNHLHNLDIKTDLKKTIKSFRTSVSAQKKDEAAEQLKDVYKKIDKATKRNLLHKNTAARRKSSYSKLLKSLN